MPPSRDTSGPGAFASRPAQPPLGSRPPQPSGVTGPGAGAGPDSGAQVLAWMQKEFQGLRSQLYSLSGSVAFLQSTLGKFADGRTTELNVSLAEIEGCAAELRAEAAKLHEFEKSLGERNAPGGGDSNAELRAALAQVERSAAEVHDEVATMRDFRQSLMAQIPEVVATAVREALLQAAVVAGLVPAGAGGPEDEPGQDTSVAAAPSVPAPEAAAAPGPAVASEVDTPPVEATAGPAVAAAPLPPAAVEPSPEDALAGPEMAAQAPEEAPPTATETLVGPVADSPVCVFPGLRIGPSLAAGVTGALEMARLRHRRRRRAGPPSPGMRRRDQLTGPLAAGVERFTLVRGLGHRATAVGVTGRDTATPGLLPVADRDGEEVSVDLGGFQPLVLLGADAPDVARSVVASFLVMNRPAYAATIVVGDLLPGVTGFPGFGHTPALGSVVGGLLTELDRRARLVDEAGVPSISAYRLAHPDATVPLLLLASEEPVPMDDERWKRILADGSRLGVAVLVVGHPTEGVATIRVQGGGTVAEASPEDVFERLAGTTMFSLAADAASDVLGLLVSARTDKDHPQMRPDVEEPFSVEPIAETPPVHVELLGGYQIDVGEEELKSGLRAKARELLAFYLLHPDGTTLDAATEALWPEADPRRGSEWFWTALGNLRSRLRATAGDNALKVIEREGDRYRVEPLFDVDVWRFQRALAEAASSTGDEDREAALDRAAAAYGGELLAGVDWPWVEVPRDDLRRRAVDVLVALADIRWKGGNSAGAWEALEKAIGIDPFAEQVYRRVMRLHARLGRPHEATETYRTLEARLGEVDLEPTVESQNLLKELSTAE